MINTVQPCFIFSASKSDSELYINRLRGRNLKQLLVEKGIPHKFIDGVYQGVHETSYLVPDGDGRKELVAELCQEFEQECYLYRDRQGLAWFIYPDGREELQGAFVSRDKETAKRQDGYSYDETTDTYWVIEPLR